MHKRQCAQRQADGINYNYYDSFLVLMLKSCLSWCLSWSGCRILLDAPSQNCDAECLLHTGKFDPRQGDETFPDKNRYRTGYAPTGHTTLG